jgi:hypothetical protein
MCINHILLQDSDPKGAKRIENEVHITLQQNLLSNLKHYEIFPTSFIILMIHTFTL